MRATTIHSSQDHSIDRVSLLLRRDQATFSTRSRWLHETRTTDTRSVETERRRFIQVKTAPLIENQVRYLAQPTAGPSDATAPFRSPQRQSRSLTTTSSTKQQQVVLVQGRKNRSIESPQSQTLARRPVGLSGDSVKVVTAH
jgi:hypothetical protein